MTTPRRRRKEVGALGGAAAPEAEAPAAVEPEAAEILNGLNALWAEQQHGPEMGLPERGDVQVLPNLAVRVQELAVTLTLTCRFPYPGNQALGAIVSEVCQSAEFLIGSYLTPLAGEPEGS